jgi:DNA replication protein DnaC
MDELIPILGGCFLGFEIPRISKEFDCLWIGDKTVVNVELKSRDVGEEKVKNQLVKNRYYLQHLNRTLKSYSYVSSTCNCYSLNDTEELVEVSFKDLIAAVADVQMESLYKEDIESLFPPEKFLVSPFNSTEEFLNGCYFLTNQQLEFKNKILQFLGNEESGNFCALTGGPSSGKTLLMYDIARTLMREGKNVVIGHSGGLNDGQRTTSVS